MAETIVRKRGEGDAVWMLDSLYAIRASSEETDGAVTIMEMTIPPGMGPPPHTHPGGESVYVLEGEVRYHIGGETYEGGPGTFFHVPAGVEEHFEPAGDTPVRLLVVYTPGGIEKFFREVGEPAERQELPPRSETPPDFERIVRVAAQHGMNITAPAPH